MKLVKRPRIALAGSVNSSLRTFSKLIEHHCNLVCVLGLHPNRSKNVSGYVDLKAHALENKVPFKHFEKINSDDVYEFVEHAEVDLLFIIGLSQLVREPLLSIARHGIVGYHPTKLPEGRGRGAVAWMILGKAKGATTFFLMDEGMDSGPLLGQHEFDVNEEDYAGDVIEKIKVSIDKVLDKILPKLNSGELEITPQDQSKATYIGQRKPKDGIIIWNQPAREIHRLVRATSKPLPGAYTFIEEEKIIIQRATLIDSNQYVGVPGRVLIIEQHRILVTCSEGAIWIDEYDSEQPCIFRVGLDLG